MIATIAAASSTQMPVMTRNTRSVSLPRTVAAGDIVSPQSLKLPVRHVLIDQPRHHHYHPEHDQEYPFEERPLVLEVHEVIDHEEGLYRRYEERRENAQGPEAQPRHPDREPGEHDKRDPYYDKGRVPGYVVFLFAFA